MYTDLDMDDVDEISCVDHVVHDLATFAPIPDENFRSPSNKNCEEQHSSRPNDSYAP